MLSAWDYSRAHGAATSPHKQDPVARPLHLTTNSWSQHYLLVQEWDIICPNCRRHMPKLSKAFFLPSRHHLGSVKNHFSLVLQDQNLWLQKHLSSGWQLASNNRLDIELIRERYLSSESWSLSGSLTPFIESQQFIDARKMQAKIWKILLKFICCCSLLPKSAAKLVDSMGSVWILDQLDAATHLMCGC